MDSLLFAFNPIKSFFKDSKHFSKDLRLSKIYPTTEIFSEVTKKVIEERKLESSPGIDINEAVLLRGKVYIFKKTINFK